MRCNNCGSENRDDAKFCRKCGVPLKKGNRRAGVSRWTPTFLFILVLLSIIAVGLLIARGVAPFNKGERPSSNMLVVANLRDYNIEVEDEESARRAIKSLSNKLSIGAPSNQLGDCRVNSSYGWTYYRFKQEVGGYEIHGCALTLGVGEDGIAESLTSNAISIEQDKQKAIISRTDAEGAIASTVGEECDVNAAELVFYPNGSNIATLCYRSYVSTPDGAKFLFVSAENGSLIGQQALSFTEQVEGRGKTKANPSAEVSFMTEREGAAYSLFDKERAITVYDAKGKNVDATYAYSDQSGKHYKYDWNSKRLVALDGNSTRDCGDDCEYIGLYLSTRGVIGKLAVATNNSTYWSDKTAVSAMHNVSVAHDFYASVLNRNGFSGKPLHNMSVCINTFSQTNSQWGRTGEDALIRFSFDNAIQLDTAAHEFTHDVEQSISEMIYEGESGALMEATSDIFAELAEDFADDGQMNNTCDWKQSGCRDLASPERSSIAERESGKNKKAHPTRYLQEGGKWASTTPEYDKNGDTSNDYGHVHNNSTVVSHAAYLMCCGDIDGEELTTKELADVLYATFFVIPSNCDFALYAGWVQCKAQTMLASSKVERVKAAFEAVGISPWHIAFVKPKADTSDNPTVFNTIPRKLITSFHKSYSLKGSDYAYEEWVRATYNERGQIISKELTRDAPNFGRKNDPTYSLDFTYDADGRLIKVAGTEEDPGWTNPGTISWDISYEGEGMSSHATGVERPEWRGAGIYDRYVDDVYDDSGNLLTRGYLIKTGPEMEMKGTLALSYDADGRIVAQSATDESVIDQSLVSRYEATVDYDQANRLSAIAFYDSSGNQYTRHTYEYDDAGRLMHRSYLYGGAGNNLTESQSYTYDDDGHLSSVENQGSGGSESELATFTTDEDGSIISARVEGESFVMTYEVEYVTINTPEGQEPFNAVDLTDPTNPVLYNELWVSHSSVDPTPFDESAFLRENRRWLELHD